LKCSRREYLFFIQLIAHYSLLNYYVLTGVL